MSASFLRPALRGHWARCLGSCPRAVPPIQTWQGFQFPVSYRLRDSVVEVRHGDNLIFNCPLSLNFIIGHA